jgi:hypothetical protein
MARRRTQKVRGFKSGGSVPLDDVLPGFGREEAEAVAADVPAPPPPPLPDAIPAADPSASDAVMHALAAQQQAERMQQQPQQPRPLTIADIDAMPWSERRKSFVRAHPELLLPHHAEAIDGYFKQGSRLGYAPDSEEMDEHIWQGVAYERAIRERRLVAAETARRAPEPPEAEREPFRPQPSMPERRISAPMVAPVAREAPSYGGKRMSSNNTLTPAEREIAHSAIPDRPDLPRLTNTQKEYMYLQQKQRYEEMRRTGEYDDTQGRRR